MPFINVFLNKSAFRVLIALFITLPIAPPPTSKADQAKASLPILPASKDSPRVTLPTSFAVPSVPPAIPPCNANLANLGNFDNNFTPDTALFMPVIGANVPAISPAVL